MKKVFLVFLIFVFSILCFELFLEYSPFKRGTSPVEYHPKIGMWHKKNFNNYLIKDCYENQYFFDSKGRVKNNYLYDKRKEDVVILGDSYIDGLMVKNNQIIHNSLFLELKGKLNVLNYGLTGSGPMQQFSILKYEVNLNNTQKVVHFIYLENDLGDGDPKKFNGSNRPKVFMNFSNLDEYTVMEPSNYTFKEKLRDFLASYELYGYLNKTYSYYKKKLTPPAVKSIINKTYFIKNEPYLWRQLKGTIYQMNKLSLKNNFEYVVIINSVNEWNNGYIKRSKIFEAFLTKQNIKYLNIASFLKKLKKTKTLGYECDGHWNENTHKQLARHLKDNLFD